MYNFKYYRYMFEIALNGYSRLMYYPKYVNLSSILLIEHNNYNFMKIPGKKGQKKIAMLNLKFKKHHMSLWLSYDNLSITTLKYTNNKLYLIEIHD